MQADESMSSCSFDRGELIRSSVTSVLYTTLLAGASAGPAETLVHTAVWCTAGPVPRPRKRGRGTGPSIHRTAVYTKVPPGPAKAPANSVVYRMPVTDLGA